MKTEPVNFAKDIYLVVEPKKITVLQGEDPRQQIVKAVFDTEFSRFELDKAAWDNSVRFLQGLAGFKGDAGRTKANKLFLEICEEQKKAPVSEATISNEPKDKILFDDTKPFLHPAQDFTKDTAWVSVPLPIQQEEKIKKPKNARDANKEPFYTRTKVSRLNVLINNKRESFVLDQKKPWAIPIYPKFYPSVGPERWSRKSIKDFLAGEADLEKYTIGRVFYEFLRLREQYVEYPQEEHSKLLALWDLGTYFHQLFNTYPIIHYNATKRTGKTKSLTCSFCLDFNSALFQSPTESSIFRMAGEDRATILIDEIKKMSDPAELALKDLLRGRYKKGITIPRVEDKNGQLQVIQRDIFGPLAIANIKGVESDIEDRCITIILRRSTDKSKLDREPDLRAGEWQDARDMAYLCFMSNWELVRDEIDLFNTQIGRQLVDTGRQFLPNNELYSYEKKSTDSDFVIEPEKNADPPESVYNYLLSTTSLKGRSLELWRPLLVLARLVDKTVYHPLPSGDLFRTLISFAEKVENKRVKAEKVDDTDILFAKAVYTVVKNICSGTGGQVDTGRQFGRGDKKTIEASLIRDEFKKNYEVSDWIKPAWVGYAMKRLGLAEESKRIHGVVHYVINSEEPARCLKSLGIDPEEKPETETTEGGVL